MKLKNAIAICFLFLVVGCGHFDVPENDISKDPFLSLEEIESPAALDWVKLQNAESLGRLETNPKYKIFEKEAADVLLAQDRIPSVSIEKDYFYNFWQDKEHVAGIWRRTLHAEFKKANPKWEIILDLDALRKKENESWVFKGIHCLRPAFEKCLLNLSRGGKDAVVVREFSLRTKDFTPNGFYIPESKVRVNWYNDDQILVGTDFGPDSMTDSGYPREIRLLTRGQKLEEAKPLFKADKKDVSVFTSRSESKQGPTFIIARAIDFYTNEYFVLQKDLSLKRIPLPVDIEGSDVLHNRFLFFNRTDIQVGSKTAKAGSLLAFPFDKASVNDIEIIYTPSETQAYVSHLTGENTILVNTLDNVMGRLILFRHSDKGWQRQPAQVPLNSTVSLGDVLTGEDHYLYAIENHLSPMKLYELHLPSGRIQDFAGGPRLLKSAPTRFDAAGMQVTQNFATSKDGTKIPYFLITPKNFKPNGASPTLLYGYGGFENSELPYYLNLTGKSWIERGGVYVQANIRGGGEYGPKWHQAALKKNRQKAYDDFIAVSEDLIRRKITSSQKLAIMGGSNGGLLVGAAFTQRPDLFKAVICGVPLLDMLRYNKLLAGASWMGEYGNPDDPDMRSAILKYSPYQNVFPDRKYPNVFFFTSTKDDRVHPGHARKMVAKMKTQGHSVLYFENIEGGHSAAANLEQRVKRKALEWTFLWEQLF